MNVCFVSAGLREAVQAGGPVDAAGRVQVAEEALSQPAPDLQRLLQTARHHRYSPHDAVAHSATCRWCAVFNNQASQ